MSTGTLFFLTMVATANPEATVPLFAFDSYLKCFGFQQALIQNSEFMNPVITLECKQQGLPDMVEPEGGPAE